MELVYPLLSVPVYPKVSFENPGYKTSPGEEILPVVDPNGLVIGKMTRSYAHSGAKILHPVVHLHILNREGKLYLQKRSMKKDLLPGYWDTAVGGHVGFGESLSEALFRESGEELSFYEYNPYYLQSYLFESGTEKELVNVFACVGNFSPVPDGDEVTEGRYFCFSELDALIGKDVLTPNFEGEFRKIRASLLSLL